MYQIYFYFFVRHPDKNNLPEAKEKFIEINRAYEVCTLKIHAIPLP
jgi:hypothetical protein